MMDKDQMSVEFAKIFFSAHPEKLSDDPEKAFNAINDVQKLYKKKLYKELHNKNEKFVDKYFEDKSDKYL